MVIIPLMENLTLHQTRKRLCGLCVIPLFLHSDGVRWQFDNDSIRSCGFILTHTQVTTNYGDTLNPFRCIYEWWPCQRVLNQSFSSWSLLHLICSSWACRRLELTLTPCFSFTDFSPDNSSCLTQSHTLIETPLLISMQCAQVGDWKNAKSIYEFSAKDIDGNETSLEKYR